MNIVYSIEPSGNCPVQAEGHVDGKPFYFRARHSTFRLEFNKQVYTETVESAGFAAIEACKTFIENSIKKSVQV